jgi:hypothetical protein
MRGQKKVAGPEISASAPIHDDSAPSYSKSCPGKRNCNKNCAGTQSQRKRNASQFEDFIRGDIDDKSRRKNKDSSLNISG